MAGQRGPGPRGERNFHAVEFMMMGDPVFPIAAAISAEENLPLASGPAPLRFRQSARARLYAIQVRHDGMVTVTIPRRGTLKAARQFADSRRDWIERVIRRLKSRPAPPPVWEAGTEILFRGNRVCIRIEQANGGLQVFLGEEFCGGAAARNDFRTVVERHMRAVASRELPARLLHLARQHDCPLRRVTIRSQRTRWGSCSRRGAISLNWRLVQLPPTVSDYVLIHELMHLREMNHSRRFWAHVERACPDYREHRRWLRTHGSMLCG